MKEAAEVLGEECQPIRTSDVDDFGTAVTEESSVLDLTPEA